MRDEEHNMCLTVRAALRWVWGTDEHMKRQEEPDMARVIDESIEKGHLVELGDPLDRAMSSLVKLDMQIEASQMLMDEPALTIEEAMQQIARKH